ncbi:branched-chain amino acid transaminase [uncultured Desulfovibrio sp.]|uniref:branched-chain amino acid transaminase n=1 Tax=uncultured Desulfovibrio sp. TaxID=167968 RepID=UPI00262BA6E2|nr:branched-chain amino acid transaminase [uncultured Desulfovibrio sp.]
MMEKTKFIWFDGKMVPWEQAQVHVLTHALHYGSAVFEGIRAYACADGSSSVFRLAEHSTRLVNSAKILRLELPYTAKQISEGVVETLKANKLREGYIRPLSFVGEGDMGVYPGSNPVHTIIAVWSWGAYLGPEALEMGIRAKTSSFARMHVNTLMSKAKAAGNYVNSILAKVEAKEEGYDEAVMLDTNGFVSEASGENIFIVRDGIIKTTPWTSILGGITRDAVMTLARDLGYRVEEQQFTRDELYIADEAFFTGTAAELTPIREVDHRTIGAGKAGPVTKHLQKEFFAIVKGENPKYAGWSTRYTI